MLNQYQDNPEESLMVNHSALLNQEADLFYDDIHVNKRGREVATKEFVKQLLK